MGSGLHGIWDPVLGLRLSADFLFLSTTALWVVKTVEDGLRAMLPWYPVYFRTNVQCAYGWVLSCVQLLIHTVLVYTVRQSLEGLCIVMRVPESISQLCPSLGRRTAVEVLEMVTLNLKSADTHNVSSSFVREL